MTSSSCWSAPSSRCTCFATRLTGPQQQALAQINELLNQSLAVSRSLTSDLSPPILRDGNLAELLQYLAQWAAQKYGLSVHLNVRGDLGQPDKNVRELLFQAVRELLLNVVKHAGTRDAEMILGKLQARTTSRSSLRTRAWAFNPRNIHPGRPATPPAEASACSASGNA